MAFYKIKTALAYASAAFLHGIISLMPNAMETDIFPRTEGDLKINRSVKMLHE